MRTSTFNLIFACLVAALSPVSAKSAESAVDPSWDLRVFERLAIANAPGLRAEAARAEAARRGVDSAGSGYLPRLSTRVGYDNYAKIARVLTFSEPEPYQLYGATTDLRWTLYDGFQTDLQVDLAESRSLEAQLELEVEQRRVLISLSEHFFTAAAADEEIRNLIEITALLNDRIRTQEEQVSGGALNRLQINQVLSQKARIDQRLLQARSRLELARSSISELIRAEPEFWDRDLVFTLPPAPPNEALLTSNSSAPEIALATARMTTARRQTELTAARAHPKLEVFGSAGFQSSDEPRVKNENSEYSFGIALTWEMTDAVTNFYRMRESRSREAAAAAEANDANGRQRREIRDARLRLDQARAMLDLHRSTWQLNGNYEADSTQAYKARSIDFDALLGARQELALSYLEMNRSEIEVSHRTHHLWTLLGRPSTSDAETNPLSSPTIQSNVP